MMMPKKLQEELRPQGIYSNSNLTCFLVKKVEKVDKK